VLALLIVAASLGIDNFAASVAIGVSGVDARTRLRVGVVFGLFESGMPVLGLIAGEQVATSLGSAARWVGAGLLIAVGLYTLASAARSNAGSRQDRAPSAQAGSTTPTTRAGTPSLAGLLLSGLALSVDNLVVGFALGTSHTSIIAGVIVIGVVSVALSLLGLELGASIGRWAGRRAEQLAGAMLIAVGIAIAAGALK
jgi:manganese efflux pump family protein